MDRLAVVIMDAEAEAARPARHCAADPAHADNAEPLAIDPVAKHAGRCPASPFTSPRHLVALGDAARYGQHQRHRDVSRILGQDPRRIGNGDASRLGGGEVDMVHTRPEGGDQFQLVTGRRDQVGIDPVCHGGNEDVGLLHHGDEFFSRARGIGIVEPGVKQLSHPCLG